MPLRRARRATRASITLLVAALLVACAGGSSAGPSSSPPASPLTEAAAKIALLSRFGSLVYCDPDFYPIARQDESKSARDHLAEMQADREAWAAIAAHFGFDPATTPAGDGLLTVYRAWKMMRALQLAVAPDGWSFDARFSGVGPDSTASGNVTRVGGTIGADGTITVSVQEPSGPPPCPICLARGTKIATPIGEIPVESLRAGDPVWTRDAFGRRVASTVAGVGSTPVPATHRVVRLRLTDGRVVFVSPGHPMPDGRPVGSLRVGDVYDGSVVASADRVPYDGGRTFDVLPAGPTGVYWANGIELGSTLFR